MVAVIYLYIPVVSPDRVCLQANFISSMTVNNDTTLICLGLESGNVSMYDIKTGTNNTGF